MMLRSTLIVSAMLALIAVAVEEKEEHNLDMEETILNGIDSIVPSEFKFDSYVSRLGQPATHEEIEDGKLRSKSADRTHQTLSKNPCF